MTSGFAELIDRGDGRYAIAIGPELAVGPPGHAYLFGGASLALALDAAAATTGRAVVQGSLQFVSFTPLGQTLDLAVTVLQAGKTLAQVQVTGHVGERLVLQAGVTLGARAGIAAQQWARAPDVPPPGSCPPSTSLPRQDDKAQFLASMEVRELPADDLPTGRARFWLRRKAAGPIDTASLALFADFIPVALGRVSGRPGGGNSVDNSLRMVSTAPPGWCLCDITITAAASGFAQGRVDLWSENGQLLATGGQTLLFNPA
ncbi:thioesterase family protein [Blastomonas sp. AAP53]|uniref:acyl-CoA thioesterase n=1 Tax=Blastomonas sp. AAP53 TaxID=1248760 RepID=UPI0003024042|nr:thioesterase family protein [Blastomonas sp. AAP53]